MVDAYKKTVTNCRFAGPTLFTPLLRWTSNFIKRELRQSENLQYYILLILTDGAIHDQQAVINQIVKDSYDLPLSIIIVGVGKGPFGAMHELDADDARLVDEFGKKQASDTVQFVEFSKFGNSAQLLTREVLEEVPRQVQDYYQSQNIMPYDSNPLYDPVNPNQDSTGVHSAQNQVLPTTTDRFAKKTGKVLQYSPTGDKYSVNKLPLMKIHSKPGVDPAANVMRGRVDFKQAPP